MRRLLAFTTLFAICFSIQSVCEAQMFPTFVRGAFTLGNETGDPYDLADTFFLETNPGASQTIYLDFDGHHSVNNVWGHDLVFDAFNAQGDVNSFTDAELRQIQTQFQNVAEDFIPFDVNVTTRDPGYDALVRSNAADTTWGLRMLNTQNIAGSGAGGGGTAYVNSFNWIDDRDNIAFAFNKGGNNGGMTNSHEIGHTLGLRHDGIGSTTYHPGTGSGDTRWGPLMGAPFNANITQWSNGDYANSTNQEDDLAIITKTANGINYRADQIGDTLGDAGDLVVGGDGTIFDWNIIEQNTDFDVFKFTAGDGQLILQIDPFSGRPNLDILAELYDASGTLLDTSNPIDGLNAAFDLAVTQGDYYLSITGTGRAGTYSDYGSLGFYTISGSAPLSSVPEPSSVLILMIGLGCVVGKRRRRNLV